MNNVIINKINKSLIYRLIFKGGQQVLALAFGIILARILSPSEFGVVAIANMVVLYANNFTNFGLNNALVQKNEVDDSHINAVFTIDLVVSIILLVFTVILSGYISVYFKSPELAMVLRWMSIYYIITTFYNIPVVILRRNIDFKFLSVLEFFQGLFTSVLAIALAMWGYSYWSIVISSLLIPFFATFILAFKTKWVPKIIIYHDMNEIYHFGIWVFIRNQMEYLVSKVDYFVIGRYLDIHSLGIYEKSFELTDKAMTGFTRPIGSVFYSAFCQLKNDLQDVKKIFLEGTSLLALFTYPMLFGLIGVAPHFVTSCLGSQWLEAILPVQILSAAGIFRVLFGIVASVNVAIGRHIIHTFVTIFSAVFFVTLCLCLVSYGIVGICFAFFIYCFISFCASFVLLYLNVGVTPFDLLKSLWCPLIGSFIMLFGVLIFRNYVLLESSSFTQLLGLVFVGAIIYLIWCYVFYRKGIIHLHIQSVSG